MGISILAWLSSQDPNMDRGMIIRQYGNGHVLNKGNKKINELRTILQRESQNS
jgi:hypothetical protein